MDSKCWICGRTGREVETLMGKRYSALKETKLYTNTDLEEVVLHICKPCIFLTNQFTEKVGLDTAIL